MSSLDNVTETAAFFSDGLIQPHVTCSHTLCNPFMNLASRATLVDHVRIGPAFSVMNLRIFLIDKDKDILFDPGILHWIHVSLGGLFMGLEIVQPKIRAPFHQLDLFPSRHRNVVALFLEQFDPVITANQDGFTSTASIGFRFELLRDGLRLDAVFLAFLAVARRKWQRNSLLPLYEITSVIKVCLYDRLRVTFAAREYRLAIYDVFLKPSI